MNDNRPVFVVLEGGGAKGVAHVGALQALEDQGYEVEGIAGTSAGALVAALYALGFSPRKMIDAENKKHVLQELDIEDATKIVGNGWRWIALARFLVGPCGVCLVLAVVGLAFALMIIAQLSAQSMVGIFLGAALLTYFLIRRILGGLARLDNFVDCFDRLAKMRLGLENGERARFHHFAPGSNGRPVLKIVATDITRGTMELFSPDKTPNVPVAEAVAASICIPVIFRSRKITEGLPDGDTRHFLDGGLVSNLPAWAFDDDRLCHGYPPTILVEIHPKSDGAPLGSPFQWFRRAVTTAIFGAKELSVRGVEPSVVVSVRVDELHFLALDADLAKLGKAVQRARDATNTTFQMRENFQDLIQDLHARCGTILSGSRDAGGPQPGIGNIRATISELWQWEVDRIKSGARHNLVLRISFWEGFDYGGALPEAERVLGTAIGKAIERGEPIYEDIADDPDAEGEEEAEEVATRQAPAGVHWRYCFPAYEVPTTGQQDDTVDTPPPEKRKYLVVMLEGDTPIPYGESELDSRLSAVYDVVDRRMAEL